jgi:gas vesicle protein GvpL/GvpF
MGATVRAGTYLYCLVQLREPMSLGQVPPGLPGVGMPRALHAGGSLWIIAADAPLSRYGPEHIERRLRDLEWVSKCALAHEAVVEFFAATAATIPMKLFTLFSSDERAQAHILRRRKGIERLFQRIAGREEWGLRVHFDPSQATTRTPREAGGQATASGIGTRFLLRKQQEQTRQRRLFRRARVEAGRTFRQLTLAADAARRRPPPPEEGRTAILLDAAFLVRRKRAGRFRRLAEGAAARLAGDGCHLTLTGPWPPYNFVGGRP